MKFTAEKAWLETTSQHAPYCFRYYGTNKLAHTTTAKFHSEDEKHVPWRKPSRRGQTPTYNHRR